MFFWFQVDWLVSDFVYISIFFFYCLNNEYFPSYLLVLLLFSKKVDSIILDPKLKLPFTIKQKQQQLQNDTKLKHCISNWLSFLSQVCNGL